MEYPTGTITFLFTDVEDSTVLWEQHPEAMRTAMKHHDTLIEGIVADLSGFVVRPRGEGDSRFVVFQQAPAAVEAAARIQSALATEFADELFPLRVRIGLHTGGAEWREGDYYGSAVNRCARIRGLGHGGQTLLSQSTATLSQEYLPAGVTLVDLGTYSLKGLSVPETIYQLWLPDLPNEFPPLKASDAPIGHVPEPPTPLIGREAELKELSALLRSPEVRLVTLTGPGGTGKTRLSLATGHELMDSFRHGVYFVDLAPVSDPALVASTIAHALGIREGGGRPPLDNLKDYLAEKEMLLILDNLEQVIAAGSAVSGLLAAAPALNILTTSRMPLQVRGEREYPLPTLPVPPEGSLTPDEALTYETVRLFVRQAEAVRPSFALTPENVADVAAICRRLDGLPLAIEIAAARVRLLPPAALLKRLDQSLKLLVGGAADLPERQQTMRAAIDWSYQLLGPEEQTLFARLGVFVGGFTLESAETVVNREGTLDVLSGLETLVSNSLVRPIETAFEEPRFDILQTIRDYALEKLEASGELELLRETHALHYYQTAVERWRDLSSPLALDLMDQLEEEHGNYRAAMAWGLEPGHDPLVSGQIVAFLVWFWYRHGHLQEGREWGERVMRSTREMGGIPYAMALNSAGVMAMWQSDLDVAGEWMQEAVRLAEAAEFDLGIALAHFSYGVNHINQGNDRDAYTHLMQSAERFDQWESGWDSCNTLIHMANASLGLGELDQAEEWLKRAYPLTKEVGDPWQIAFCLNNFGEVARSRGDYESARDYYVRSEAMYREADAIGDHARLIHTLGYMALRDEEVARAEVLFLESLDAFRQLGNKRGMAECVAGLAAVAIARDSAERAAVLLVAAETQMRAAGAAWWPADRVELKRTRAAIAEQTEAEALEAYAARGRALSLEEAMALATRPEATLDAG